MFGGKLSLILHEAISLAVKFLLFQSEEFCDLVQIAVEGAGEDFVGVIRIAGQQRRGLAIIYRACRLMDVLFQLVNEFLEIAVGNVVTAPVRDSIELDAVRELHVEFGEETLAFGAPPRVVLFRSRGERLGGG